MRSCLLILLAACAASEKTPPDDRFDDLKSDMFSSKMKLAGALAAGDTHVDYRNPPRYVGFTLPAGAVDVWVRSPDGDAVAWLTDGKFKIVANNDDADSATFDAHVQAKAAAYLFLREYSQAAAQFTITLTVSGTPATADVGPAQIVQWNAATGKQQFRHDYSYDRDRRLSSIRHFSMKNGSWTQYGRDDFSRDGQGRITAKTELSDGKPDAVTHYDYDSDGRLIALRTLSIVNGVETTPIDTLRYQYGAQFRTILFAHGSQTPSWDTSYQFHGDQLTEATASFYPDGSVARFSFMDSQLGSDGNLTQQSYRTQQSGPLLGTSSYFYDASGRIDHIDELDGGKLVQQTSYSYSPGQTTRRRSTDNGSGALVLDTHIDITWTSAGTRAAFAESDPTPVRQWAVESYGSGAYFSR
jgi:hypothetical protein